MATQDRVAAVLAIEGAVLAELADELEQDGLDEHAARVRQAVEVLDTDDEPVERVKKIVVILRPVDFSLRELHVDKRADAVRKIRRRLAYEADRLLADTQKLSTGEYEAVEDDDD